MQLYYGNNIFGIASKYSYDEYYRNQNELPMIEMVAGYVNERLQQYYE
ncbi:MAG: hypothetical protein RRY25_06440 [Anaerovorax sp.]